MKPLILSSTLILMLTACATSSDLEETRRKLDQVNQQASNRLSEVENKLANDKLLEMISQVESLKAEVAKLRGETEVLSYNLQTTQKRQNDLFNDLDSRLSTLEKTQKPEPAASAPSSDSTASNSRAEYDQALDLLRAREFPQAANAFRNFIQQNPQAAQIPDANYWLGVAHTALKQYDAAIDIHRRFVKQYPNHPLAPEALRNIGNSQQALDQLDQARATYKRLIKLYPKSESAKKAKLQLEKL
ncbi:tol-pal system protein YbgF [Neisseriaceae bacterium TC5R-5]|nr:tol-pal system protein YbgF [Neisseriaceae bacterium TC5R-5]